MTSNKQTPHTEVNPITEILRNQTRDVRERTAVGAEDVELDDLYPSFLSDLQFHKRQQRRSRITGFVDPTRDLYLKFDNADFAQANGLRIPEVLAQWDTPEEIDWDSLPDKFVIKSTRGAGGMNVFPLTRKDGGFEDGLSGENVTSDEVVALLNQRHYEQSSYFAEEYLEVSKVESGRVPQDIKVFCFYGRALYIEVRVGDGSRVKGAQLVRAFLPDGTEVSSKRPLVRTNKTLPAPRELAEIVRQANALSAQIKRPAVRLDFFETDDGLFFGEVSDLAGRTPVLEAELDRELGAAYEDALARLYGELEQQDLFELTYGDHVDR